MPDRPAGRGRLMLVLIFLAFFGPAVAAWILIETGWRPGGHVNHGDLVQPVQPMAQAPLSTAAAPIEPALWLGRWSLLVTAAEDCGRHCQETLNLVGRIHVALNKDQDRVQVGLVLPQGAAAPALPERVLRMAAPPKLLADWAGSAQGGVAVQLIDFRGQRMMRYTTPLDGSGLLKDIRRLLRLSNEEAEQLYAETAQ